MIEEIRNELQSMSPFFSDLMQWVANMTQLVSSDEMASDVTGAEGLLERHQEYRTEIDARSGTFVAFEQFGNQLLAARHYASADVEDKLRKVAEARDNLEKYDCLRKFAMHFITSVIFLGLGLPAA